MVFKIVRRVDGFKADATVSMKQETQEPYSNQILTETDPRFHSDLPEKPVELNKIQSILQNVGRLPVVAAEEAIGTPRAIGEFVQQLINIPLEEATGVESPLGTSIPFLPKSETIREYATEPISQAITGQKGMLESRGDIAQGAEDIVRTAVPFLFSGGAFKSLPKAAARALGISSAGNFAKWGSKKLGFGEGAQEAVKLGTMLGTSMMGLPGSRSYASKLYNSAEKNIPEAALVEFGPIRKQIEQARKGIRGGLGQRLTVDSKEFLQDFIGDVEGHLKPNGRTIPLKELFRTQKDYNTLLGSGKVPQAAKNSVGKILGSFKEAFKSAPKSLQPFITNQLNANDIWRATSSFGKFSKMVNKYPKLSSFAGLGGGAGLFLTKLMNPATAGLGAAGGLGANFLKNMVKHPGMRNYYANLMKSIGSESVTGIISNAKKLYNESQKVSPETFKEEIKKDPRKKSSTFRITRRRNTQK